MEIDTSFETETLLFIRMRSLFKFLIISSSWRALRVPSLLASMKILGSSSLNVCPKKWAVKLDFQLLPITEVFVKFNFWFPVRSTFLTRKLLYPNLQAQFFPSKEMGSFSLGMDLFS